MIRIVRVDSDSATCFSPRATPCGPTTPNLILLLCSPSSSPHQRPQRICAGGSRMAGRRSSPVSPRAAHSPHGRRCCSSRRAAYAPAVLCSGEHHQRRQRAPRLQALPPMSSLPPGPRGRVRPRLQVAAAVLCRPSPLLPWWWRGSLMARRRCCRGGDAVLSWLGGAAAVVVARCSDGTAALLPWWWRGALLVWRRCCHGTAGNAINSGRRCYQR